ncbi:MAG: hypothetical protein MZV49_23855 [Rhodopseudomonas palustris]|nr:hypothetical protein [Rhodopseudomonas palustris]
MFTIGLNRAVTLIAEKIAKGPSKRRFGSDPGKPLGDHPQRSARWRSRVAATVPMSPLAASTPPCPTTRRPTPSPLEEAIALIDERAAKGGTRAAKKRPATKRGGDGADGLTGRQAPAKKAAAKKAPARRPAKTATASKARTAKTAAAKPAKRRRR